MKTIKILSCIFAVAVLFSACKKDEEPIANFSVINNNCVGPCTLSFENASLGTNNTYQWDFGDGSASLDENPSHEYVQSGDWTVTLNVTNESGFSQIQKDVRIEF